MPSLLNDGGRDGYFWYFSPAGFSARFAAFFLG